MSIKTRPSFSHKQLQRFLNHYLFLSYLIILGLSVNYLVKIQYASELTILFSLFLFFTYPFMYLLPGVLFTKGACLLLCRKSTPPEKSRIHWVYVIAILTTVLTSMVLFLDQKIFTMFGFHLNGFVLNLIITPGGIEALGASRSMYITSALIFFGFIVLHTFGFMLLKKFILKTKKTICRRPLKIYRYLIAILILMTLTERIIYGVSHIQGNGEILAASNAFPFYQPVTFRSFAKEMGYTPQREIDLSGPSKSFRLAYPQAPLHIEKPKQPLNIVWLVAESWRWDMLNKEIMPRTWKFSKKAHSFTNCYSGGNGTRMGIFAMFYGLYGPYWFPFLNERRSPAIMDVLETQQYQIAAFTSAKFSYPEFSKTVFANIPKELLHEYRKGHNWEKDRKNVSDLINFIKHRDPSRPFMTFMFFESPHARYYFPEESIIRTDYIEHFNYASASIKEDIKLIFNRYINACHHLDSQYGRIIDFLEQNKLLKNTIVIITGDHGEEFMEKGRWGHNSAFHEEQVKVPLVLYIPRTGNGVIHRMVSHLDIPATVMPHLGVKNKPEDYSLGYYLLGPHTRDYTVLSDWDSICLVTDTYKARFPLKNILLFQTKITTLNDRPVKDVEIFYENHQKALKEIMQALNTFGYK